jgi:lambda family phage tail tape measure protein
MATTIDKYQIKVDTQQATSSLLSLKSSLAGLAAAFSIREIIGFSDSITGVRNRLRLLQPTAEGVERSFQGIAKIAMDARTPLEQTADLYFRIARSADSLGISQREAARITESVSKALVTSGISANEAAGPLLQLGQALQSGTFQGDELRSILEGLPPVAKALADSLGVPVGALRKLGSEGQITGQQFVKAMRLARDSIEKDFARTLPTVGQSFTNLKTQIGLLFAEIDNQTGVSQGLAGVIGDLTKSIKELGQDLKPIAQFFRDNAEGLATLARAVGYAISAYLLFGKVLPAIARAQNAIITAIKGGGVVFTFLGRQLIGITAGLKNFALNILRAFGVLKSGIPILGSLTAAFGALAKVLVRFLGWIGILYSLAEVIDFLFKKMGIGISIIGFFGKAWDALKAKLGFSSDTAKGVDELNKKLADSGELFDDTAKSAQEYNAKLDEAKAKMRLFANELTSGYTQANAEIENGLRLQREVLNLSEKDAAVRTALFNAEEAYLKKREELGKKIREIESTGTAEEKAQIEELKRSYKALSIGYEYHKKAVEDLTVAVAEDTRTRQAHLFTIQEEIRSSNELAKIQDEMAKLTLNSIEQKYYDIEAAAKASAKAAIEAEEARRNEKMPVEEQRKYYDIALSKTAQLEKAQDELFNKSRKFSTGWTKAMKDYIENATDAARQAENIFKTAVSGMEEAIVNFAKTGKFEWKSFVSMMLEELLRAQIQQTFANMMGGMQNTMRATKFMPGESGGMPSGNILGSLGGIVGSIGSSIGKLFGGFFADGGTLGAGKFGVVGERGPELISGPATITPLGMGGSTYVTYNINAVDAMSFKQLVAQDPGFMHAVVMQGAKSAPMTRR